jgi:hypothetical protein
MGRSATNEQAFGAAGMTTPADKVQLALGMIHEFLHSQLAGMWHAEELTNHVDVSLAYAPWRDDPRPVHKLLQGAYAHLGVADFWRTWRDVCEDPGRTTANLEYARWRQEVARTVEVIEKAGNLNQAGLQVLDHVKDRLHGWQDDVIPADALEYAMQGAADHELSWRVRNCRPDPQLIKEMATAWRRGEACPSGRELSATVIADNSGKDFTLAVRRARRTLLGRYLRSPDEFWQLAANESALQTLLPAATHADTFLVAGDIPAARREYAAQLIVAPHNTEPWGGLALTFRGQAPSEPAVTTLLQHPEYAAALYQALDGKADPLALAVWLG